MAEQHAVFVTIPSSSHPQEDRTGSSADLNENWDGDSSVVVEYEEGEVAMAGRGRGKAREANLSAECLVCGGAAAAHQHYGAICCYSCRAFFRRGIMRNYSCVRGDDSCQVNSITRTNCKKCRYERCLEVGMRPELVDASLRRKQEEKRRQEILDIQEEMGIQTVEDRESESQAVTGMMQLHHGVIHAEPGQHQAILLQHHNSHNVIQAVQDLQEPLPRHLLAHQVVQQAGDLSPASVGRKKVLLELRHQEAQKKAAVTERSQPIQIMEPQAQSPPLRQQTYYIFHPVTQTFEPITIAEFEENGIVEEVVVGDNPIEKTEEGDIAACEHDYKDNSVDDKSFVSQNENARKRRRISASPAENLLERKPVISPVVRELSSRPALLCEPRQEIKISRKEVKHFNQTSVIKKLSNKLIEDTVNIVRSNGARPSSDLGRVIEETIGEKSSLDSLVVGQEAMKDETEINIEALVDVCFEEELYKADTGNGMEVTEYPSQKRKSAATSFLPLKKRRGNDREMFAVSTEVDIFSHKIIPVQFTCEENLRLKKLCEVLKIFDNSDEKTVSLSVKHLLNQVVDLRQPVRFTSSLSSVVKCSPSTHHRSLIDDYLGILGPRIRSTKVLALFSRDESVRGLILLLKVMVSFLQPVWRNLHLLLYRYLSSLSSGSEAAAIISQVEMILSSSGGKT